MALKKSKYNLHVVLCTDLKLYEFLESEHAQVKHLVQDTLHY